MCYGNGPPCLLVFAKKGYFPAEFEKTGCNFVLAYINWWIAEMQINILTRPFLPYLFPLRVGHGLRLFPSVGYTALFYTDKGKSCVSFLHAAFIYAGFGEIIYILFKISDF